MKKHVAAKLGNAIKTDEDKVAIRKRNRIIFPNKQFKNETYPSINAAKRRSFELQNNENFVVQIEQ